MGMGTSSLSDTRLTATVEKLAGKSTLISFISIGIALSAICISAYSIHNSNITTKANQAIFKEQLQVMRNLVDKANNVMEEQRRDRNINEKHLININKTLNEIKHVLSKQNNG